MNVDILQFSSPFTAFFLEGKTETKPNGHNYLIYKDNNNKQRELLINDDVEPIIFTYPSKVPLKAPNQVATYILARDNFLTYQEDNTKLTGITKKEKDEILKNTNFVQLNKGLFKVSGMITNEQITQIANWGMIEALVRATKSMDRVEQLKNLIGKIFIFIIILIVIYLVMQWISAGGIALPF